jgi:UDP-N-acetylmuramate--alanine ligase
MKLHYHFVGVAGCGMSALAQFHVLTGGSATGSDRSFDQGKGRDIRRLLETAGVGILPQDGVSLPACDAVIISTAVEEGVPDVRAARERGLPLLHRSELLARHVRERRSIAVTGTSGKSTVTAMIFEILRGAGRGPSLLTGGDLILLQEQGLLGNAYAGTGDLLVLEADESDGSLVRYEPWMGVLLNLQKDHKEPAELAEIFAVFRSRTRGPFVLGEEENLRPFAKDAVRFGLGPDCPFRAEGITLGQEDSSFTVGSTRVHLPVPGLHNVLNATAAAASCSACGVPLAEMTAPLERFRGVARRFQLLGSARGCEVVDDFAHNPEKLRASLATAHLRRRRILAVFQPHGFGPTRFLRDELIDAFSGSLGEEDRLYLLEIFYAGGTAVRDISSREIAEAVAARGRWAAFVPSRGELLDILAREARAGDMILVMGARDPSLTDFCREVLSRLGS